MLEEDDDFIRAFETGALPNSAFHHRDHVRLAWLYLRRDRPEHLIEAFPSVDRFDALLAHYPRLADKTLVYRHYRPETLASPSARAGWTLPDLLPLP